MTNILKNVYASMKMKIKVDTVRLPEKPKYTYIFSITL